MLAYAGIEAASNLAPDIDFEPRDLKRIVSVGAIAVPLVYAGMAAVALMAVPVVAGPAGPETALGSEFVESPVLGVVSAYDPSWLADAMRWLVALVAAPILFWAAGTSMLGVSRHIYTLAINRQIPELARQARQAPRDPSRRDRDLGGDGDRVRAADRRRAAGRDLRLRGACSRSRSPTSRWSACGGSNPIASGRSGFPSTSAGAGPGFPCRRSLQPRSARSRSSASSPTTTAPAGSGAAGCSSGCRLRRLPPLRRGHEPDRAGLGHRAGPDQDRAEARVRHDPRARLRHQAR